MANTVKDMSAAHLRLWSRDRLLALITESEDTGPGRRIPPASALHLEQNRRYLLETDARRSNRGQRTEMCLQAFRMVEIALQEGRYPTLSHYINIHSILIGEAAQLRTTTAHAGNRRHAYITMPIARELAERWRLYGRISDTPMAATLLYLDVIFLHPFQDGNGRAARLLFEWFCLARGTRAPQLEPIVFYPKIPGAANNNNTLIAMTRKHFAGHRVCPARRATP